MLARPQFLARGFIIAALCSALALLGGCSALRIAYAQAPDLAYWWLDGYVDFNDAQTPKVREALAEWFAWHRRTQLPDYANQLARAQAELAADTTAARACEWQGELLKRAHTAWERAAPAAADLVLTVTPQQIQHVARRYAKSNAEFRDDYLQPNAARRAEVTLKRTVDRAETLYGRLTEAQRTRIAEGLQRSPFDPEVWFSEREQRQQAILAMLRRVNADGTSIDEALAAVRTQVEQIERSPREAYRRYTDRLNEFNCAFAANLHNSTSAAQRRTAAQKLAGWEGDLRALVVYAPR